MGATTAVRPNNATNPAPVGTVDLKLEVVAIPVSDVDRAKAFYGSLGWRSTPISTTAPTTWSSSPLRARRAPIHFGTNLTMAAPGSAQGFPIVSDINAAREELVRRGVDAGEVFHLPEVQPRGPFPSAERPLSRSAQLRIVPVVQGPRRQRVVLQQITTRLPGRVDSGAISFQLRARPCERISAGGNGARRAREADRCRDANWPEWYSAYMVAEQDGESCRPEGGRHRFGRSLERSRPDRPRATGR